VKGLHWYLIGLEVVLPPIGAVIVAYPFWRWRQMIFGNLAGTGLIFACAFGLIFREYAEIDQAVKACLDAGVVCWPEPSAFTRFAIYAFIALAEVLALFLVSIKMEERGRRRDYAPEWR
jgi:hypothetical protein